MRPDGFIKARKENGYRVGSGIEWFFHPLSRKSAKMMEFFIANEKDKELEEKKEERKREGKRERTRDRERDVCDVYQARTFPTATRTTPFLSHLNGISPDVCDLYV